MNQLERPYLLDKPLGATPLEALGQLRGLRPELNQAKLAYAGRLDPMATGLLVILGGSLLSHQEEFWNLPKVYEVQIILGVTTDSYDLLGLAEVQPPREIASQRILEAVTGLVGKTYLSVPVFSSQRSGGKPMFAWARQGIPAEVEVPVRQMSVSEIQITDLSDIDTPALWSTIQGRIPRVQGDFRQQEILERWRGLLDGEDRIWTVIHMRVCCAGGTYIRSLAHEIGRRLGTGALLADLRRTRVGQWTIDDPEVIRPSWPL